MSMSTEGSTADQARREFESVRQLARSITNAIRLRMHAARTVDGNERRFRSSHRRRGNHDSRGLDLGGGVGVDVE